MLPRRHAPLIPHPVIRVPGAKYIVEPGRPLTIIWPNGRMDVAAHMPVVRPAPIERSRDVR